MNAENAVPRRRLPFWRTVIDAYILTYNNLGYLARISWAWALLMVPISLAFYALVFRLDWHQSPAGSSESIFTLFGTSLLFLPMFASVAVAWHRKLLENETWPGRVYLRLDRVVADYIYLGLFMLLLVLVPFSGVLWSASRIETADEIPTYGPVALGCLIAMCAGIFVATRIWVVLPARALNRGDVTVKTAWAITHGHFWRLFWGSILCVFPTIIVISVLVAITFGIVDDEDTTLVRYAVGQTLSEFFSAFLAGMPAVSFLSLAYRWLVMDVHDEQHDAN